MMWSDAPAAAPPAVPDVPAGGMSRAPPREALVSQAPPPSPAAAPATTPAPQGGLPPRAPPLGGKAAPAADAGTRPLTDAEETELRLRAIEDERFRRAQMGSPLVRHDAAWLDKQRTIEGKQVDPAAIAGFIDAQDAATKSGAEVARYQAERDEEARQAEAGRGAKLAEHDAIQKEADEKAAKEDREFEDSLDRQRRELADPNSFWNDKSTGYKVAMTAAMALSGIGAAIAGREPGDLAAGLNRAIEADLNAKKANLGLLGDARRRARERYGDETKVREVARNAAMRQVDDTLKDIALRKANPVVRQMIEEEVPVDEGPAKIGRLVFQKMRAAGNFIAPDYIDKADPTPTEMRAREEVRYLGAEYQQAQQQLATARERLGIARDLATSQSLTSAFIPAHTTGGGGDGLKLREQQLKERISRGGTVEDRGIRAAEAGGKMGDAVAKAEDREGARVFMLPDGRGGMKEYIARAGTDPKTVTKIQEQQADLAGFGSDISELEKLHTIKDRALANTKLTAIKSSMVGKGTKLVGGGVVGEAEFNRMNSILSATDWFSPGGVEAAKTLHQSLAAGTAGLAQQVGAKPRGGKLWLRARPPSQKPRSRRRSLSPWLSKTARDSGGPSTRPSCPTTCTPGATTSPSTSTRRSRVAASRSRAPAARRRFSPRSRPNRPFWASRATRGRRRQRRRPRTSASTRRPFRWPAQRRQLGCGALRLGTAIRFSPRSTRPSPLSCGG